MKKDYLIIYYPNTIYGVSNTTTGEERTIRLVKKSKKYVASFVDGLKADKPFGFVVRVEEIKYHAR